MGDFPEPPVTPSRPFLHSGVDYAGPVMLQIFHGRGHKTQSLQPFLYAAAQELCISKWCRITQLMPSWLLRQFISRQGVCQVRYLDCGTNFVDADTALRNVFQAESTEAQRIGRALAEDRIQWRFDPPTAPHFRGLWEAAVKSLKHHLRRVTSETLPSHFLK
ncbi:PREDICTED: uncharacterized protein LOC108757440 [Trachymyrmex cornetzi]|uniref:uncharacterized protein LOC108757440 n=1 Tax=Trachymyrmex cornetzi TaxID=471704 RepID=UPI00084F5720|nr:PREDICTED: uncharacterized protein LOC108757440 [Trachymyrmex cornetzi]